mgnify:CR=1 FL=1
MKKTLVPLVLFLLAGIATAAEPKPVVPHLQNISVTIKAGFSEGSGVLYVRDGQCFVWTAAHVVDGLRNTRKVVDPKSGTQKTIVEFADAKVVKTLIESGRTVGRYELDAQVLKYSDATHGEDLAILRVRAKDQFKEGVTFYDGENPPTLGTRLYHVGSLLGEVGSGSLTDGIVSQHGRLIGKTIFDQTNATSFPGSSGGGIYLADKGTYVGMLVRGAGEGFSLYVPVRRMRRWAKEAKVEWAMSPKIPLPPEKEIKAIPIEDIGKRSWKVEAKTTVYGHTFGKTKILVRKPFDPQEVR